MGSEWSILNLPIGDGEQLRLLQVPYMLPNKRSLAWPQLGRGQGPKPQMCSKLPHHSADTHGGPAKCLMGDPEAAKSRALSCGDHRLMGESGSRGECKFPKGQVTLGKYFIACPAFLAAFFRGPLAVMCDCDRQISTRDSRAYCELDWGGGTSEIIYTHGFTHGSLQKDTRV